MDAAIVADVGVFSMVKKYAPHVKLHVSTQASISNYEAARAWHDLGASRVILARELSLEEISTIGLSWKEDITISSMCTVFADSEVVSLVAQNKALPDIVHGLNRSVAARAAALFRRVKGGPVCMMTGGVARNAGVVSALEEALGLPLFIHEDSQLCGALGAALFALEM